MLYESIVIETYVQPKIYFRASDNLRFVSERANMAQARVRGLLGILNAPI